jgi:pyrimidine operon attenuation protein / uracil phosphoribosyltransferase
MRQLLDAAGVAATLARLADQVRAELTPEAEVVLVGLRTRGVPLAQRLAKLLHDRTGVTLPVGTLDITLYRDDLRQRRRWPEVRGTAIPFPIDQRRVLLVDDVLYTGRTVFAAITALNDLGRPNVLRLIELVDRGHREYPVQADYVGLKVPSAPGDRINVRLVETDGLDEVEVQ